MNPPRPNLFEFATSELSQDAALCWCLAWADSKYAAIEPAMHAIGRDLVASLFDAAKVAAPEGSYTVVVKRQLKHVDIVAELGDGHLLAIEDKVHASEHSEQLKRYAKSLKKLYPERSRALVFLKTGDQSSYGGVEADGWTTFLRLPLLAVLRRGSDCTNAIYRDFLDSLEGRETAVRRFETTPLAQWAPRDPAYTGLFLALQTHFQDGRWGYVANPSGGFMGFWWNFITIRGGKLYLQLEDSSLMAKVAVKDAEQRRELRKKWSHRVVDAIPGFAKPGKFGSGEYMTVATRDKCLVQGPDGRLDLAATVKLLRETTAALSKLAVGATKP